MLKKLLVTSALTIAGTVAVCAPSTVAYACDEYTVNGTGICHDPNATTYDYETDTPAVTSPARICARSCIEEGDTLVPSQNVFVPSGGYPNPYQGVKVCVNGC